MAVAAADVIPPITWLEQEDDAATSSGRLRELQAGEFAQHAACSDLISCLPTLLVALDWPGTQRQLIEALPRRDEGFDVTDLRNALAHLGFGSKFKKTSLLRLDDAAFPCLLLPHKAPARVALGVDDGAVISFDPADGVIKRDLKARRSTLVLEIYALDPEPARAAIKAGDSWFRSQVWPLRGLLWSMGGLTLGLNLLALAVPLFVMTVYDRVIGTASIATLNYLCIGVALALIMDFALRHLRSRSLVYCSARLRYIIGSAVIARLVSLPCALTDRMGVNAQVSRVREVESIRGILVGPLANACLDLPFVVIFIVTIYLLAGNVVMVPLAALAVYAVIGALSLRSVNRRVARAGRASTRKQEFALETLDKMRTIRFNDGEGIWLKRFTELSEDATRAGFASAQASALISTMSQTISMAAGLSTLAVGVHMVLGGTLTTGALIASMILVWRILAPLQSVFVAISRLHQVRSSVNQLDNLMRTPAEREERQFASEQAPIRGDVSFERVSHRYGQGDPELSGVSFSVKAGEAVAVVGPNGSGKSTILKLIVGLYRPQMGSIRIDGRDLRQFDPAALRGCVAYVPQVPELFDGTITDNLRIARPGATEEQLWDALECAGLRGEVEAFSDGLDTHIDASKPHALSSTVMMRLSFARAYLRDAPIVLLDEPITGLDCEAEFAFLEAIDKIRGRSTVFIVSHRPSHLGVTDSLLVLDKGTVRYFGPTEDVRHKLPKELM